MLVFYFSSLLLSFFLSVFLWLLCSSLVNTGETLFQIAISPQPLRVVRAHEQGLPFVAIPPVDTSGVLSYEEVVVS